MTTQPVDVKLSVNSEGITDIDLNENGDLVTDDGFETTIRLTIWSRRRGTEGEVPTPEYRGGWIGNMVASIPGFESGSKLWLLDQARLTDETKNAARSYLEEAFAWFVEDGLAKQIEVQTQISNGKLEALIKIDGEPFYMDLWNNTIS